LLFDAVGDADTALRHACRFPLCLLTPKYLEQAHHLKHVEELSDECVLLVFLKTRKSFLMDFDCFKVIFTAKSASFFFTASKYKRASLSFFIQLAHLYLDGSAREV
jgi:hypothetical protein